MNDSIQQKVTTLRNFNRFYTNIIGIVNQTILSSPYSLAEARILTEIDMIAPCTASDLTTRLQIDPGYLSRILRRFKKENLIESHRSVTDARALLLSVTAKGRQISRQLSESSTAQLIALLEPLSPVAQRQLVGHMAAVQGLLSGEKLITTLRDYQPGDLGYIAYRHGALYAEEYDLDGPIFEKYVLQSLIAYLENPAGGRIFVAEYGGKIAGFVGIVAIDKSTAQLRWFLIEPEFRGLGLGRQLVQAVMDHCREHQYSQVFLWTFKGLDAARHLYEQFGFTLTEEKANSTWKKQLIEQRWEMSLGNGR